MKTVAGAESVSFPETRCAICGTTGNARELYQATLSPEAFSARVFSARRLPDGIHYRIVRCTSCGLVRSDPIAPPDVLERLYAESSFSYEAEVESLTRTYGRYLSKLNEYGARKEAILEVGCGNGFFLSEAARQGYQRLVGVEPSHDAVKRAVPGVEIIRDVMRPGLFSDSSFDVVCMFQVLDHLPDPVAVLRECRSVLRPGGLLLCVNHDVGALSARILGERSPIIDIEHTYLFDRRTMGRAVAAAGFEVQRVSAAWNLYPLRYLTHLLPMPLFLAKITRRLLALTHLGGVRWWVPLGNLYTIARRPL